MYIQNNLNHYLLSNLMTAKAKALTLEEKLRKQGFKAQAVIKNDIDFVRNLLYILQDSEYGKNTQFRIVPAEILLEGTGLTPSEPSHVIYAKIKEKQPCVVLIDCLNDFVLKIVSKKIS